MEGPVAIKRIVYTINLGGYDRVIENHHPNPNWSFWMITDRNIESDFWNVVCLPLKGKKASRKYKWLTHHLFNCEYSLYVDANVRILTGLDKLVEKYLKDYDMATYKHRCRSCLYAEGFVCIELRRDFTDTIERQLKEYRKEGYPVNNGLIEGHTLLRRHTDKINMLDEFEWGQIQKGSYRDQLSFNYSAWKLGVKVNTFKGMIKLYPEAKEVLEKFYGKEIKYDNPYFEMEKHCKLT